MGFFKAIADMFRPKRLVKIEPDPETIKRDKLLQAMSYELTELKADNAKKDKTIAEFRERSKDKNEEENVKIELHRQAKEIGSRDGEQAFSMKVFWGRYFRDKKFRNKLAYFSFDRSRNFGKFGDIRVGNNGDIIWVTDEGREVMRGPILRDQLQSVGALGNDIVSGKIPLWLDKEGDWVENILEYEVPELLSTGNKLIYSKAKKRPVYEIIQDLNSEIAEARADREEAETMIIELQNKVDTMASTVGISEKMAETSRAELTSKEERLVGIDRVFGEVQKRMVQMQNIGSMNEETIASLEEIKDELREKAERGQTDTGFEDSIQKIDAIKDLLKEKLIVSPAVPQSSHPGGTKSQT